MNPKITLLMATYQSAEFINRTLDSIQGQTFRDFTCLITDDCSDDETVDLVQSQVGEDPRFILKRNPRNVGWTANVNQMLDQVKTPYFMIMPHDDELEPACLIKTLEALEKNPSAIGAYTDVCLHLQDRNEVLRYPEIVGETDPVKRGFLQMARKGYWWLPYHALFRTQMTSGVRLRRHPMGEYSADLPWLLEMGLRGPMIRIPEILFQKHYAGPTLSKSWNRNRWNVCSVCISCLISVWSSPVGPAMKLVLSGFMLRQMAGRFVCGLLLPKKKDQTRPAMSRAHWSAK